MFQSNPCQTALSKVSSEIEFAENSDASNGNILSRSCEFPFITDLNIAKTLKCPTSQILSVDIGPGWNDLCPI